MLEHVESERIRIFDENHKATGVATRSEVHSKGYWHETFHCWFYSWDTEGLKLYFQWRSPEKKDFPNQLDITAAGHLLEDETVVDGIREVEEELGIAVPFGQLISVGVIKAEIQLGADFIDKEHCHVFLYNYKEDLDSFSLQKEEVLGIIRADLDKVRALFLEEKDTIKVDGFRVVDGLKQRYQDFVSKGDFVPHNRAYFKKVISAVLKVYNER